MKYKLTALLLVVMLAGCGQKVEVRDDKYVVPAFEWRIRADSELRAIYLNSGMELKEGQRIEGFVGKDENGWPVIYTGRPKTVDDSVACTLGHEVMHLSLGDYHK